jgi:hypothetical protein
VKGLGVGLEADLSHRSHALHGRELVEHVHGLHGHGEAMPSAMREARLSTCVCLAARDSAVVGVMRKRTSRTPPRRAWPRHDGRRGSDESRARQSISPRPFSRGRLAASGRRPKNIALSARAGAFISSRDQGEPRPPAAVSTTTSHAGALARARRPKAARASEDRADRGSRSSTRADRGRRGGGRPPPR